MEVRVRDLKWIVDSESVITASRSRGGRDMDSQWQKKVAGERRFLERIAPLGSRGQALSVLLPRFPSSDSRTPSQST